MFSKTIFRYFFILKKIFFQLTKPRNRTGLTVQIKRNAPISRFFFFVRFFKRSLSCKRGRKQQLESCDSIIIKHENIRRFSFEGRKNIVHFRLVIIYQYCIGWLKNSREKSPFPFRQLQKIKKKQRRILRVCYPACFTIHDLYAVALKVKMDITKVRFLYFFYK